MNLIFSPPAPITSFTYGSTIGKALAHEDAFRSSTFYGDFRQAHPCHKHELSCDRLFCTPAPQWSAKRCAAGGATLCAGICSSWSGVSSSESSSRILSSLGMFAGLPSCSGRTHHHKELMTFERAGLCQQGAPQPMMALWAGSI